MTMRSKCIFPPILSNLVQFTLKLLRNAACLGYVVREYPDRSITSLTRQFLLAKVPMQPLVMCMTSSFVTGQGKLMHKLMRIIVGHRTKTIFFIWYHSWRILCGLHKSILYSFLIEGHTKFSPDWCFGLIKQSFRRHYVSSLFDLMSAVDKLTVSGVNISKLCGLHDGTLLVPVYDWVTFLEPYFKKIPGKSNFHHFRFSKDHPGVVFC